MFPALPHPVIRRLGLAFIPRTAIALRRATTSDGSRFEITVRSFADPARVLTRAAITEAGKELGGDPSAWMDVPCLYLEYLRFAPWRGFVLIKVVPSAGCIEVQRLEWYGAVYDKDYQGLVDVLELFGGDLALVSVQRSSRVIVHDLRTGTQKGRVDLGKRCGNPKLQLREKTTEIWGCDYDTVVVIASQNLRVFRRKCLQSAWSGTQQFIGDFTLVPL